MKSHWALMLCLLALPPHASASTAESQPSAEIGDAWTDPRNPITQIFGGHRLDLWSLKPVKRPSPPSVQPAFVRNAIDQFVVARLQSNRLRLSPPADRRTLARRLYFSLTGLPPTPEEMRHFLNDCGPMAYERLIDRLLDSPRYGEHWARLWLDVVRYSDSNGFDWDEFRPTAWRFRDYVVRSFNADKPFDLFIREQLAGDELIEGAPANLAEQDALIATGYLRLGPHDNSASLFNEQARSRAELMFDLVDTTGSAFLGLTFSCCRCHDHKTDPLSHADYYRLRAFFEPVKFADDIPIDLAHEQQNIIAHNKKIDAAIAPLSASREALLAQVRIQIRQERTASLTRDEQLLLSSSSGATDETKKRIQELETKLAPSESEILQKLSPEEKQQHDKLSTEIEALAVQRLKFTTGLLMTDTEGELPTTKILFQGDYQQERNAVPPGVISVLDPNAAAIAKPSNSKTTGRRLTLANWIASPDNPFTARVLVNRVWQAHFGRGLVATANDFGLAGAAPTHPELLDWLASEFVAKGWSLKQLHRLILTSATFRQRSVIADQPLDDESLTGAPNAIVATSTDSDNTLLWRQNPRRLSAEQIRDSLLAASGELRHSDGGPPVWPDLPRDLLTSNPAFLDDNEAKTKGWYPSPAHERNVRTLFLVQKRTVRIPFLEIFDLPENATSCPRRTESIVAPQALSLLNGDLAIDSARAFAKRVSEESGSGPESRVERAFQLAFQRQPGPDELSQCVSFLKQNDLVQLCRALVNVNEFVYFD